MLQNRQSVEAVRTFKDAESSSSLPVGRMLRQTQTRGDALPEMLAQEQLLGIEDVRVILQRVPKFSRLEFAITAPVLIVEAPVAEDSVHRNHGGEELRHADEIAISDAGEDGRDWQHLLHYLPTKGE